MKRFIRLVGERLVIRSFLEFVKSRAGSFVKTVTFRWDVACSFSILVGRTRVFSLRWSRFLGLACHASVQPVGTNWKGWRLFAKSSLYHGLSNVHVDFHDLDVASRIDFFHESRTSVSRHDFSFILMLSSAVKTETRLKFEISSTFEQWGKILERSAIWKTEYLSYVEIAIFRIVCEIHSSFHCYILTLFVFSLNLELCHFFINFNWTYSTDFY